MITADEKLQYLMQEALQLRLSLVNSAVYLKIYAFALHLTLMSGLPAESHSCSAQSIDDFGFALSVCFGLNVCSFSNVCSTFTFVLISVHDL